MLAPCAHRPAWLAEPDQQRSSMSLGSTSAPHLCPLQAAPGHQRWSMSSCRYLSWLAEPGQQRSSMSPRSTSAPHLCRRQHLDSNVGRCRLVVIFNGWQSLDNNVRRCRLVPRLLRDAIHRSRVNVGMETQLLDNGTSPAKTLDIHEKKKRPLNAVALAEPGCPPRGCDAPPYLTPQKIYLNRVDPMLRPEAFQAAPHQRTQRRFKVYGISF